MADVREYLVWSKTSVFARRLARAQELMLKATAPTLVSVSWGKDSVAMAHLSIATMPQRLGLPYATSQAPAWVKDRRDARIWIRNTSLNRRNLPLTVRAVLIDGSQR